MSSSQSESVGQDEKAPAAPESSQVVVELEDYEKRAVEGESIGPQHDGEAPAPAPEPASASIFPSHPAVEPLKTGIVEDVAEPQDLHRTASAATQSTDTGQPGEDDESKYITGMQLHLLTFGLTLSTFVIALDNTIIATAIPKITTVFNSLDDVGWYGSSYLLTTTSLQPSFGKVYTYFNVKWTYMLALVIFEFGSVLCGAAVNSTMLIVGRAVAGAGAAALFSGGMNIIGYSVPLRKRPIYIGLLSSMFGIASVVGPILGGAFTDRKSIVLVQLSPTTRTDHYQASHGVGASTSIFPSAP